jgi:hypothetical protein
MKVEQLNSCSEMECVLPAPAGTEVSTAFTSDLLSDVMAHAEEGSVLITIQAHKNTVAVATLVGIRAILACSGRTIPDDMAEAARERNIAIYRTPLNQFEATLAIHGLLTSSKDPS